MRLHVPPRAPTPWPDRAGWAALVLCTPLAAGLRTLLDGDLRFGLGYVAGMATGLLVIAVALQLALDRYQPVVTWAVLALATTAGLLVPQDMVVSLRSPWAVAAVVAAALAVLVWGTRRTTQHGPRWLPVIAALALGGALAPLVPGLVALVVLVVLVVLQPRLPDEVALLALVLVAPSGAWIDADTVPHLGLGRVVLLHLVAVVGLVALSPRVREWSPRRERHLEGGTALR